MAPRACRHRAVGPATAVLAAAAIALVTSLTGCSTVEAAWGPLGDSPAPPAGNGTALAALDDVPVKGRAPKTGYDRDQFGVGWVDIDGNGCDTRNDVLARDLTGETFRPGTRDCVVTSGTLAEPYAPATLTFQRGESTSSLIQIDHVVALSDAWQKGAQRWTDDQREDFANDPLNLLAVDGTLNMAKSDADAATWLPPNRAYRCTYVARQVAVKLAHGLWMTKAEHDASADVLDTCPEEPLPADDGGPLEPAGPTGDQGGSVDSAEAPPAAVVYASCAAVRASGAAPISEGEPGFDQNFDGDGDGVGCEG